MQSKRSTTLFQCSTSNATGSTKAYTSWRRRRETALHTGQGKGQSVLSKQRKRTSGIKIAHKLHVLNPLRKLISPMHRLASFPVEPRFRPNIISWFLCIMMQTKQKRVPSVAGHKLTSVVRKPNFEWPTKSSILWNLLNA